MSRIPILALCVLALPAAGALADSWLPPQPQLASSEDGRWYVASNPGDDDRGARLLLVRRASGKAPRTPPEHPTDLAPRVPAIEPEAGDVVVARAEGHLPLALRCLNEGKGFVLFDTYAAVGTGVVLARYDGSGQRLWTRRLSDFFAPRQLESFPRTVSSIWWSRGLWIDEARGKVVIAYELDGPHLLEVDLASGEHRPGDRASVLGRFGKGSLEEQVLVLDLARRIAPAGLLDAARAHLARTDLPREIRIRLAVILAEAGDHAGDEVVLACVAEGQPQALRRYAVEHLPVLLGEAALPHLRDAMRGPADEVWHAAMRGLEALGASAVPTLIEMVGEEGESSDYRGGAASVLGSLEGEARPAVPALLEAARTAPEYVANAALNALVRILPEDELGAHLITLLAVGSNDDGRIALFFREHPRRDAVRALEVAHARHREDEKPTTREWIEEALARCRRPR